MITRHIMEKRIPARRITVCDVIVMISVIAVIVISSILLFGKKQSSEYAAIKTDKETINVPLGEDGEYEFSSGGYHFKAGVKDGEISVIESDCPDGICKNTSAIGKRNGTIVCVPAHMIIECRGEVESDGADVVVP